MNNFKSRWEIQKNWQLIFPLLGTVGLLYSGYKISHAFTKTYNNYIFTIFLGLIIAFILLRFTLFIFKKLENKWKVSYKWEMIRIFIVFAITGSSSMVVGRPLIKFMGITLDNLNPFIYWILFVSITIIFYQILLVAFGWLFGQFNFFWEFEKKMLRRLGLGPFID